jgi:signal transduction histidine kinase
VCGLVLDRDHNAAPNLAAHAAEFGTAGSGPVAARGADRKTRMRGQVAVKREPGTTPVGKTGTVSPQGGTTGRVRTKAHWQVTELTSEYRWLLPAVLTVEPDRPAPRRSTRDWAVDTACFVVSLGFTLIVTAALVGGDPGWLSGYADDPKWLVWTDLVVGVAAAILLWWRRRWPVQLTLYTLPFGLFTITAAGSFMIMLFTVVVHRKAAIAGPVVALFALVSAGFIAVRPERGAGYLESLVWTLVLLAIVVLWGMVVRSRRQLVVSLRDRAERAEAEQQLRVIQARFLERTRIAREMHDVLAHRISLLSLHAGALEIRPDAAPADVAGAAGVIRASAHQALQDLREVIGVLREPDGDGEPERPQPTLRELHALADESRAAGVKVRLEVRVEDADGLPAGTGRTAYRIVQEGLTNARKHAPGTTVRVAVGGAAGSGLSVEVRNPVRVGGGPLPAIPGTGTGLVGLTERATLAGGRLTHGRTPEGEFALQAWLPWPA